MSSFLNGQSLLEVDLKPEKPFKKVKSIALFKFDGKLINSGRIDLIDHLSISHDFYQYLLKQFSVDMKIKIIDTEKKSHIRDGDSIKILRSKDVDSYDEKVFDRSIVISKDTIKAIDVFVYGKINKFYKGKSFQTSYIDITVYMVDSKSKIIYWISGIRGCLKHVTEALISIIYTGDYSKPDEKSVKDLKWVNPYEARVKNWSLQYRRGYFIPTGELGNRIGNGWIHNIALNFKLPVWGKINMINQIEFCIIPSFETVDETDSLKDYTFNTYLPLMFNFIYVPDFILQVKNISSFLKGGIGFSYNKVYFSGMSKYQESGNSYKAIINAGLGVEYILKIGLFRVFGKYFRIDQIGFLGEIDFYKWLRTDISSNGINLSFGIKYYF